MGSYNLRVYLVYFLFCYTEAFGNGARLIQGSCAVSDSGSLVGVLGAALL